MKNITWKVVLTDDNRIASLESAIGLPQDKVESHLIIIGLLENLKQKHISKLSVLYSKDNIKDNSDEDL